MISTVQSRQSECCLSQLVITSTLLWQHSVVIPYTQHCISWQTRRCNCPSPAAQDESSRDLLQDNQPLRTTVIHFTLQPWASEICVHAHTRLHHAIELRRKHACIQKTHLLIAEYLVKNRTWTFEGSSEFRGDTSSSVSPQGHSLQAAAAAAITALHLPAPFN